MRWLCARPVTPHATSHMSTFCAHFASIGGKPAGRVTFVLYARRALSDVLVVRLDCEPAVVLRSFALVLGVFWLRAGWSCTPMLCPRPQRTFAPCAHMRKVSVTRAQAFTGRGRGRALLSARPQSDV